jgi:hypothetical protein
MNGIVDTPETGMRASLPEFHLAALDIRYDPRTNAIVFAEDDWSADVRGPATPRTAFREQLETGKVKRLFRRRAA